MKFVKFSQILDFQKKSHIKAGDGLKNGSFPFFTSSPVLSKYVDSFQFETPSLIFGTGGSASVHICEKPFSVSTDCLVAQLKSGAVHKFEIKFVHYYLVGNFRILEKGFKGAGLKHISKGYINDIDIPELPIEEQKRIVKILDEADALRQKRKQAIVFLDDYLKSVFLDMFGDPVKNPKGWKKQTLKLFGQIITGNTPPRNDTENYSVDFIEWIKTDNIVADKIYLTSAIEYLSEEGLNRARFVMPGAVLVACIAGSIESIGRCAIADRKVSFNQQINAIQPNAQTNTFFLYWLLKISKQYIQSHATKGMKRILTKGGFEKIMMIMPPRDVQDKFVEVFKKTEALKQSMFIQSAELEAQFQVLMQKAFKGEL